MNKLFSLKTIGPIDGRYRLKVEALAEYFSEASLIKNRVEVELRYLLFLSKKGIIKSFTKQEEKLISRILRDLTDQDLLKVKQIEEKINHDIKAIEYFLKEKFQEKNLSNSQFLHFGLTSEDTDNLVYSLCLQKARNKILLPALKILIQKIAKMAGDYKSQPMLARTHGQPAVPTTMGKELLVFALGLFREYQVLARLPIEGKLTGAVGNFNAHLAGFPKVDWLKFLAEKLAISRLQRDLSDKTVKRNIGLAFAYCLLGYQSCLAGLEKLTLNEELLRKQLLEHWEIITEGIQTILKVTGDSEAFERLKEFSQGKKLNKEKRVKILIDEMAVLSLDTHRAFEAVLKDWQEGGRGATGRGIGPAYADVLLRHPLRVRELMAFDEEKIKKHYQLYQGLIAGLGGRLAEVLVPALGKIEKIPVGSLADFVSRLQIQRNELGNLYVKCWGKKVTNGYVGRANHLVLTHMDIVYPETLIKICMAYEIEGREVSYRPDQEFLNKVTPKYIEMPTWDKEKISQVKKLKDLPKEAKNFLKFISKELNLPILMITFGPKREQGIIFPSQTRQIL